MPTDGTADSDGADDGLLAPAWAGTPVAAATGDRAVLTAILDVEVALVDAYADWDWRRDTAPDAVDRRSLTPASTRSPSPGVPGAAGIR